MTTVGRISCACVLLSAALCPLSCGSDGGAETEAAAKTGTVAILLADGPADDYDEINITVTKVTLIPSRSDDDDDHDDGDGDSDDGDGDSDDGDGDSDDGDGDSDDGDGDDDGDPVVIFRSSEGVTVNLLDLREEDYVLTVNRSVREGTYSKIRLEISDIEAVGGPCEDLEIKLPSGKIDLVPGHTFDVVAGATLAIRLDMDMEKSTLLHPAGKSGKCIFRPVVFVDIMEGAPPQRCPRLIRGDIDELIIEDDETVGAVLKLAGGGTLEVRLREDTVIFDEDGLPAGPEALAIGQLARVRGRLDDDGRLQAVVVILGEVLKVDGVVETAVQDGRFEFDPESGEAVIGDTVEVELTDATFILLGCDTRLDVDAILPGMRATVVGKLDADEGALRAIAVFLSSAEICGELVDVERVAGGYELTIVPDNQAEVRVAHLSPDAPNVDVRLDGEVVLSDAPFQAVSDYLSVRAGEHSIQVIPAGEEGPAVIDATVDLAQGTSSTVAATGLLEDLQPLVLVDDRDAVAGSSKLRFVHASPDAPAVDVVTGEGAILFGDVQFREASEYLTLDPGIVDVEVRRVGTDEVILAIPDFELEAGVNVTVFAVGLVGDETLAALPVEDGELQENGDERTIFLPEGAEVALVGDGEVPVGLLAELVECQGRQVCVRLEAEERSVTAAMVGVEPEEVSGTVTAPVDVAGRLVFVDGAPVRILRAATILDLETNGLIPIAAIRERDDVEIFGLAACEDDAVGFYGFVVLVLAPEPSP